jgi:isopropylmalate/homocitrate/citramalate synthase
VWALGAVAGCHFHNTRNTGFTNALAAVEADATGLDASVGGLGGCPFAPRATGNIATEDLVYLLRGMPAHVMATPTRSLSPLLRVLR